MYVCVATVCQGTGMSGDNFRVVLSTCAGKVFFVLFCFVSAHVAYSRLAVLQASGWSPISVSHFTTEVLGLQMRALTHSPWYRKFFYGGSGLELQM